MNDEIVRLEEQIKALTIELSQLKARLTEAVVVRDYTLSDERGSVTLRQLFGDRKELLVIHNMGMQCAYCTAYADGFNGILTHLLDRAAFVVISPDHPRAQQQFAASRGWRFRMVSARGTSFSKDLGFEDKPGDQWPGASAFKLREDSAIIRVGFTSFDPGDRFSPIWPLFELFGSDSGGDWSPKISYVGK